jgi:hypothetical protein
VNQYETTFSLINQYQKQGQIIGAMTKNSKMNSPAKIGWFLTSTYNKNGTTTGERIPRLITEKKRQSYKRTLYSIFPCR